MSFELRLRKKFSDVPPDADLTSYEFALALDKRDQLSFLRDEFHYPKMKDLPINSKKLNLTFLTAVEPSFVNPDEDSIYLCGNSLGLMAKKTEYYMKQQLEKWAKLGVLGHTLGPLPWAHCDEALVDGVAKLVGAKPVEVVLMNSLTVNLHCLLTAFYKPSSTRWKILLEQKAFPSDHYAIEAQIRLHNLRVEEAMVCMEPREGEDCLRNEDIIKYIEQEGSSIAIILFSGVHYYTGQYFDIQGITNAGHKKGCLVAWDLAHAFANVPLLLHEWDVDFAVWCTYKYASSGAGGIGAAFVHEKYKDDNRERLTGWWGHKMSTRFYMDNKLELEEGAAGYRISTPPAMLTVPLLAAIDVFSKTSMSALREKSIWLTGYLEFLVKYYLSSSSPNKVPKKVYCSVMTPSRAEDRGCQLSLKFNIDISKLCTELGKRGVVVDKRYPYVIRVTPVHLYNSFSDVHRFVTALLECLNSLEQKLL
ncbi:unnamed protein product [Enterobius vermicularis]|uniref:Kynureninase n=1 Tax=Enterobius vermicularis TaxID=51028 RepID=A0A0N4USG3_ENTVE|nr:unnamed protein product [Enterobius vermicularis]